MLFETFHLLCFPALFSQCLTFSFLLHLHSLWKFRSFPCRIYFLAKFYCCFPSLFLLISTLFWQFVVTFVDKPLLPYCFSAIPESVFVCLCYCLLLTMWNIFLWFFLWLSVILVIMLSVIPTKSYILLLMIMYLLSFLHSSQSFFFFFF